MEDLPSLVDPNWQVHRDPEVGCFAMEHAVKGNATSMALLAGRR